MQPEFVPAEAVLARLASRAHGVVTRAELSRAGVSAEQIKQRVSRGSLIRVHHGVYRVGHAAPSVEARYMAAVKACGAGAALSGRAAAHVLGLVKASPPRPDVTAPKRRNVRGVRTRRSDRIERVIWRGIPVTSVPRTLVDLAADLAEDDLARACHEAEVRHRTTPEQVEAVLSRKPNAPGAATLRRALHGETNVTLSRLEQRFLRLLEPAGLPLPETNRPAGGRRIDCRWPDHHLTVELDSYRYHSSRYAWELDRRREREAYARGDQVRRYTWGDVFDEPAQMLRELHELLT